MFWVQTEAGARMPLIGTDDGEAAEFPDDQQAGRVQQVAAQMNLLAGLGPLGRGRGEAVIVRTLADGEERDPDHPIWLSHFVDCPQADEWRNR